MTPSPLAAIQQSQGAVFDGVPVPAHYGDVAAEYAAARQAVVLVDRSDEGRLELSGADRLAILHRMSTNAVSGLTPGQGTATVLTTPIGRIIDRVIVHNLRGERALLRTSPGRAGLLADYLRRNVFFRDKMQVRDLSADLVDLALYGPGADTVAATFAPGVGDLAMHDGIETTFQDAPLLVVRLDPLGVGGVGLIAPVEVAPALWQAALDAGAPHGLRPAGSAVCELLRIEAGMPGAGELNEDYIPLEAGLWDDVSFNKGCYTGQEIIARLESRGRLAKTLVRVTLSEPVAVGSVWTAEGRKHGALTSLAQRPDGTWIGLGFVKPDLAGAGTVLAFEGGGEARVRVES